MIQINVKAQRKMCDLSSMIKIVAILILATAFGSIHSQASEVCPANNRKQFYPSFNGTSSFIQCISDGTTVSRTCPQGLVFKPRTSVDDKSPLCVSSNTQYGKAAFGCTNVNGNAPYSEDQTIYVTCRDGKPLALLECPQGEYFIESIQQCNMTCAVRYKIGSFALADGSYYTCDFNFATLRWNLTTHTCSTQGDVFYESYQFCLPPGF